MKKRLLSAFLAVMMVLTMVPAVFAADITDSDDSSFDLADAISKAASGDTITLPEGTFDLNEITVEKDKSLTFVGAGKDKTIVQYGKAATAGASDGGGGAYYGFDGAGAIAFQDVTLQDKISTKDYFRGFVRAASMSFTNCKFTNVAGYWGSGAVKFTDCDFTTDVAESFNMKCYSGTSFEFDGCTFQSPYGFIDAYRQGMLNSSVDISINNCEFIGTGSTEASKPAVRLCDYTNSDKEGGAWNVAFTGTNTVNNAKVDAKTGTNLYGCRFYDQYTPLQGTVSIDGEIVWQNGAKVENVAEVNGKKYSTLADAVKAAEDGDTVTLLNDITEGFAADKNITINLNGKTWKGIEFSDEIIAFQANGGNVVIENGTIAGRVNAYDASHVTIAKDVTIKNAPVEGHDTTGAGIVVWGDGKYGTDGCKTPVLDLYGSVSTTGEIFAISTNGTDTSKPVINIHDGANVTAADNSTAVYLPSGNLTVEGGSITGGTAVYFKSTDMVLSGGTFTGTGEKTDYKFYGNGANYTGDAVVIDNCNYPNGIGNVQITGGEYNSNKANAVGSYAGNGQTEPLTGFISGGCFTTDPSAYCVAGKTGVKSDLDGYAWTVGTLTVDENDGKVGTETKSEATTAQAGEGVSQTDAEQIKVQPEIKAEVSSDEKDAAVTELVRNGLTSVDEDGKVADVVTITKKTYLDVKVTSYELIGEENTYKIAMDITPKYDLIATSDKDSSKEVTVASGAELKNVGATKVSVTLPLVFANKKIYIDHNNGQNVYVATADANGVVEFTTNGFSPFTFALTNPNAVAEVNGSAYKTLQEAADAAGDGAEIIVNSGDSHKLDFSTTKSVKITNKTGAEITVKFNGTDKKIAKDATETFSYTKSSSGSSGGGSSSSSTTYKVSTSAVANGGVTASPSTAKKGDKITITLSPNKGYKLDKLTVTDGSGKAVSVTKSSDTVYTFTMPASQVTVGVSYVKADGTTEQPSDTKLFSDVSSSDWFNDAVKYVVDKGMMNGVGNNKFAPNDSTTRGMLMTVIARYAGQDTTGSNPWYQKGMEWAKANGVSDGTQPEVNITREQLVTMLYRYAKSTGKDVSIGEDTNILSYTDATTVSEYAIPAMQWACGAGIVNGSNGKLLPKNNATRAEVAAILMRFCENVK